MLRLNFVGVATISGLLIVLLLPSLQDAYGNGLTISEGPWHRNKLPFTLSFNGTAGDDEAAVLQLTLYENKTGQTVPAVTYDVNIKMSGNEPLLNEIFHAENGTLVLNLSHNGENATITSAHRDQFLNAWVADNVTEPIVISSPEISPEGAYDIHIEILGVYHIRNLLPPDQVPEADFVWDPASDAEYTAMIVPEFSMVAAFAIATAMVGIVVAASRFKNPSHQT